MTDLNALADRVERLQGPDREVDAAIHCAALLPHLRVAHPDDFEGRFGYTPGNIKVDTGFLMAYSFTRSIDDALCLKPKHCVLITLSEIKGDGMPMCVIGDPGSSELFEAVADTMPLALTAAALRARALSTKDQSNG